MYTEMMSPPLILQAIGMSDGWWLPHVEYQVREEEVCTPYSIYMRM